MPSASRTEACLSASRTRTAIGRGIGYGPAIAMARLPGFDGSDIDVEDLGEFGLRETKGLARGAKLVRGHGAGHFLVGHCPYVGDETSCRNRPGVF